MSFLPLAFHWTLAQVVRLLKWGIPLALLASFFWQVILTSKTIDGEKERAADAMRVKVTGVRKELENVRTYENWLRRMSEAKAVDTSPSGGAPAKAKVALPKAAASAPEEPTKSSTATDAALLYKAQADVVQLSVKALEQALPLLEQEAETGNTQSVKKLMDSRVKVVRAAVKSYIDLNQLDGRKWEDIKAGMQPPRQAASSPTQAAGEIAKPDLGHADSVGGESVELETAWWPVAVGLFPVLVLLLWAWRANDPYTIQATPEYEAAVSFWQERLLKDPDTASPRELKRFMNLSRYAVARLRPQGAAAEEKTLIPEARIVEFTAKWLLARAASEPVNLRRMLVQPVSGTQELSVESTGHPDSNMPEGWTQASAQDAEFFLRVVGDLGTGEPEEQRQPPM